MKNEILISVNDLCVHFPIKSALGMRKSLYIRAVSNVSLDIYRGEVLGVVGESGSGKSTLGRALLRLNSPKSGSIKFNEMELTDIKYRELSKIRRDIQMIFQNPNSSLNPSMRVRDIIREPLAINRIGNKQEQRCAVEKLLCDVALSEEYLELYPHQLSGGQRQRVALARALVMNPLFIVADEPVSALDVSVQAQIVNLLKTVKEEQKLTYMFISHDLSVVEYLSNRIAVMYLGRIVELAPKKTLFSEPKHPYTQLLLDSIVVPDPSVKSRLRASSGEIPSPIHPPPGCAFHPRCPNRYNECMLHEPKMTEVGDNHFCACILYD